MVLSLDELRSRLDRLEVEVEEVRLAGGNGVLEGLDDGLVLDALHLLDDRAEDDHVREGDRLHVLRHLRRRDVDDLDVRALHLAGDERRVDEDRAARGDRVLELVEGRLVHHHQDVRMRDDRRADRIVRDDHRAVACAAAHLGSVGRKPAELLVFNECRVREDLAGEQETLPAETSHYCLISHFQNSFQLQAVSG